MLRIHHPLFVLTVLALVVMGGCVAPPTSTALPPVTAEVSDPAIEMETVVPTVSVVETGTATPSAASSEAGLRPISVSNVTVDIGIGSPIPVDAFVSGEWPDLCAQLAQITQRFEGNTFEITLLATAAGPDCPPDYIGLPFRIAIPINVVQLPEGEYTVTVNGASTTFSVPVLSPAAGEPTGETIAHYRGPNPYDATQLFDVAFDAAVWEYVEDDGSSRQSQLKHRSLPGCAIWLRAGPVDATEVATLWRAEREWTLSLVQPTILQYATGQDDTGWIFGVLLSEAWSGLGNSNCQDAAEQVIDTFTVVQ